LRPVCLLLIVALLASAAHAAEPAPRKGVLLLYDENQDFSGLANLDRSLKGSLGGGIPEGMDVYTEFMDISRFREPDYQNTLRDFYRRKYAGKRIDLMIGVMSPSLEFLLKHGDEISPGTPIVFCGIDKRELAGRNLPANMTGVLVKREFKPTLETALRLHPNAREVFFIAGTSAFNQYWREEARRELSEFEGRVKINYMNDLPMESLQAEVARLPRDSIILFLHLFRDGAGKTFSPNEAFSLIAQKANVPVYVFFDQYVGGGSVGGFVYSVDVHGTKAAQILKGERPADIPTAEVSANVNMFDARQLRRWNISETQLPPGAVVRFREAGFWQRYRWHVIAALAIIIAQAVLIFALLFQHRRRTLAELAYKKAQAEVQQRRAELAHVSRVAVLGELTATLAHEINQPLTAIRSNSAAARSFLESPQPDLHEVRGALTDIYQDTKRAGEIIRRLRAMLKRDTPGFTNVDVNDVIRTVEHILHSDAILHGVTVDLDLSPGVSPVKGDTVQLQQVMLNLMVNAVGAMSEPGLDGRRLIVRTQPIEGSKVVVEVQDSGTGIAPEKLESIFDPFITTKPDGLGMGLSICRSIIERHGGKVSAANNPDRGATFSITLPVTRE
jgi:signal transduction histidine kinase